MKDPPPGQGRAFRRWFRETPLASIWCRSSLPTCAGRLAPLRPSEETAAVEAALADLEPRLEHGLAQPLHFRRQLGGLVRALPATWLLVEADTDTESEKADVAAFFIRRRVSSGYDPEADGGYASMIDRVLADNAPVPASAARSAVAGAR